MQARKMILETDRQGRLVNQPKIPPNARMEAIFLIPEKKRKGKKRWKPSPVIAEKGKILGDIVSPVSPSEDWDVLRPFRKKGMAPSHQLTIKSFDEDVSSKSDIS